MCYTLQVPLGYHVPILRDNIVPYIMLQRSIVRGCAYSLLCYTVNRLAELV